MKNAYIQIFLVKFKNEISFHEISLLRGSILKSLGEDVEILFHNHADEKSFRYSYPLIQYKRIHKKAAIFCIGDGVEAIGQFLASKNFSVMLGERPVHLEIDTVYPKRNLLQTWDSTFKYHLRNWLPLNSENYRKFIEMDGIAERITFLEQILIGNLLSFAKGMDIMIEKEITCKLLSLSEPSLVRVKGVKMMSFDAEFKTNLSLPDYMGIGKHVSIGFGTIVRVYNEKQNYN